MAESYGIRESCVRLCRGDRAFFARFPSWWRGIELERAKGGVLTRSYVSNLRKGRIENPGMDKLAALARAMGFPPALGCVRLPPREKGIVLGIVQQFETMGANDRTEPVARSVDRPADRP